MPHLEKKEIKVKTVKLGRPLLISYRKKLKNIIIEIE